MIRQIVKDYSFESPIESKNHIFNGTSAALKSIVFHIFDNNSHFRQVLDIGFGRGELGQLIKSNPDTAHWAVDGIDGFEIACRNIPLFEKNFYRNIWHGYANEFPSSDLGSYDLVCLLDVIEHLDSASAKSLMKHLLSSLGPESFLFISTPLWFFPQDNQQEGDLEEHLIGVPATSMMSLMPKMYATGGHLVGNFVFGRESLQYIDHFEPTTDRSFDQFKGAQVASAAGMKPDVGILFKVAK